MNDNIYLPILILLCMKSYSKKLIFLLLISLSIFLSLSAFSQIRIIPNRLIYNFTRNNETIKLQLIYNDSVTVSTSNKTGYDTSFSSKSAMNSNSIKGISIKLSSYDSIGKFIKRNFNNQTILERQQKIGLMPPFWVQENWVPIDWQLLDRTKQINGYECKMAKGTFRGREYTVWYAPTLPYPYGPWKLFGLPGIILEAHDKKKQFHFVVDTLTYVSDTSSEFQVTVDTLINLKEYVYYQDNITLFEDEIRYKKSMELGHPYGGPSTFKDPLHVRREAKIERMYEWETKIPRDDNRNQKPPQQQVIIKKN